MNIFKWFKSLEHIYYLTKEEKIIWKTICDKVKIGYNEWFTKTHGDDLCGPWIKDVKPEEVDLLDKIHEYFYGKDWYITLPLSTSQCCYVEYDDIKDKVK